MFTHLHVHSHYSLLDGLSKIDDLLDRCKELGMDSIALTDHGVLYGAIEFFIKAKERGIKPIIGCEMYITPNSLHSKDPSSKDRKQYHLILLAKNEIGYKNLMKLISIAHLQGFYYKPRIDKNVLRQYREGLVGLSACGGGEIPSYLINGNYEEAKKTALEYKDIFEENSFFLEVQDHPKFKEQKIANDGIFKLSKEVNLPVVATCDSHYVNKEDNITHDILLCIQTNKKVYEKDRMNLLEFDLSLRPAEEIAKAFKEHPEVITNTQRVVEQCNLEIKLGEIQLPEFQVPEEFTTMSYLRRLTEGGLKKRFPHNISPEQKERMEYELSVIEKTGFASYFLIVQDFVNWAKNRDIVVGPGRGSAAGSFVSYLLNITNIDPIKYKLLFERFLNPDRISMPDIDLDFADDRRDEVIDYVRQKYGQDHVAQIITFGTMAARAAIRDTGRALGLAYDFCDKTAKMIPMGFSIEKTLKNVTEFRQHYEKEPDAKKLIDFAKHLEGVARHASMHACGVVITKNPVTDYTPLQNITGAKEGVVTQYSASTKSSYVEKIGLLKVDFLGLRNLTIIQNAIRIIKKTKDIKINMDEIPLDDKKTFQLLQETRTTGIFQLESGGMRRYLKQLKPSIFEDIIAMVALYRPGPMEYIPDFIAGKHGLKKVQYIHPKLEPILKNTYGVAVYQEQLLQIARDLAGFSYGEADILRKAVGKKIVKLIQEQKIKFIERCVKNGVNQKIAEQVFTFIEPFAGYGFNRSHAACYALIGYQTAYLKAHFPTEFMAAILTSEQNDIERIASLISECKEMKIKILSPDINHSLANFTVINDNEIRFGLSAIKNVGNNIVSAIIKEREENGAFSSISNFVGRVQNKDLNKKSLEALIKSGAMDSIGERNELLNNIEVILNYAREIQKTKDTGQISLFDDTSLADTTATTQSFQIKLAKAEPAKEHEKLIWEKELLGLYISEHPIKKWEDYLKKYAISCAQVANLPNDKTINIGGVISQIKKIITKNGKPMLFVKIEDLTGTVETIVFPNTLDKTANVWQENMVVIINGQTTNKDGTVKILCNKVKLLE